MIFRLRPAVDTTIDELKNEYLWFAKPYMFKDKARDANISAFIQKNEGLEDALSIIYTKNGIIELGDRSKHIGICCFTQQLPKNRNVWKTFPKGLDSIAIAYDEKKLIESFTRIGKPNPFVKVEYVDNPLSLEIDNGITYIKETIDENSFILHNIKGELKYDSQHGMDDIMTLLLSRISSDFNSQDEKRIFLSGIHLRCNDHEDGYKFSVSNECIDTIFIPRRVVNHHIDFINKLKSIKSIRSKLQFL